MKEEIFRRAFYSPQYATHIKLDDDIEECFIDCRIACQHETKSVATAVLLPGFGSGWEGMVDTAYEMFIRGYNVIALSLPGYGSSRTLPADVYKAREDFSFEGDMIGHALEKIAQGSSDHLRRGNQFHLIGHSMGAQVMVHVARLCPEIVRSVIMVNPSNLYAPDFMMPVRFVTSGIAMRWGTWRQWQDRPRFSMKQQTPFSPERLSQRKSEIRRLMRKEQDVTLACPVRMIFGQKDTVFPLEKQFDAARRMEKKNKNILVNVNNDFYHNPTTAQAPALADVCDHFICDIVT